MKFLRLIVTVGLATAFAFSCPPANAQDTPASIQQKLEAEYPLTKPTADKTDIVTAGAVLVLEKDNLLMFTVTTQVPPQNTYKNGRISHGVFDAAKKCKFCPYVPGVSTVTSQVPNVDQRTFVAGEKFWVTKIDVESDGVVFSLFSDPYSDVRYYANLKFPFVKGSIPPADQVLSTVAEVVKVQPSDDSAASGGDPKPKGAPPSQTAQAPSQQVSQGEAQTMAPIAPPPPPADAPPPAPKTIAVGQTKDQVVAIFGQPTKVVQLKAKEIDVYPDMKVTFVNGKVTDVQ